MKRSPSPLRALNHQQQTIQPLVLAIDGILTTGNATAASAHLLAVAMEQLDLTDDAEFTASLESTINDPVQFHTASMEGLMSLIKKGWSAYRARSERKMAQEAIWHKTVSGVLAKQTARLNSDAYKRKLVDYTPREISLSDDTAEQIVLSNGKIPANLPAAIEARGKQWQAELDYAKNVAMPCMQKLAGVYVGLEIGSSEQFDQYLSKVAFMKGKHPFEMLPNMLKNQDLIGTTQWGSYKDVAPQGATVKTGGSGRTFLESWVQAGIPMERERDIKGEMQDTITLSQDDLRKLIDLHKFLVALMEERWSFYAKNTDAFFRVQIQSFDTEAGMPKMFSQYMQSFTNVLNMFLEEGLGNDRAVAHLASACAHMVDKALAG